MFTTTKICFRCKEEKDLDSFELRADTGRHRNDCESCRKTYYQTWYEQNKDKRIIRAISWNNENRERRKEISRKSAKRTWSRRYFNQLKRTFGLTKDDYVTLAESQNNACAICNLEFTTTPHVDHDHKTNQIRGLLCGNCNRGLGQFKDSIELLELAYQYLQRA